MWMLKNTLRWRFIFLLHFYTFYQQNNAHIFRNPCQLMETKIDWQVLGNRNPSEIQQKSNRNPFAADCWKGGCEFIQIYWERCSERCLLVRDACVGNCSQRRPRLPNKVQGIHQRLHKEFHFIWKSTKGSTMGSVYTWEMDPTITVVVSGKSVEENRP